jgi:hypothetical protein
MKVTPFDDVLYCAVLCLCRPDGSRHLVSNTTSLRLKAMDVGCERCRPVSDSSAAAAAAAAQNYDSSSTAAADKLQQECGMYASMTTSDSSLDSS